MGSEKIMTDYIKKHIENSVQVKQEVLANEILINSLHKISNHCVEVFESSHKILLAGNGGSAADAQHIAAEFVSRFRFDRQGLPSISLSTDTSMLTAIGNDYGYENIFSRQLQANGCAGDAFIAISTSGNSKNIVQGVKAAREKGITTIGFTGGDGGELLGLCDYSLCVPSESTALIQESHIMFGHIICGYVEDTLFGSK